MSVTIRVLASVEVTVTYPTDMTDEEFRFMIEENGCPGTGGVGTEIEKEIKRCEPLSVCWACNLRGENKVLSIERTEDKAEVTTDDN